MSKKIREVRNIPYEARLKALERKKRDRTVQKEEEEEEEEEGENKEGGYHTNSQEN